MATPRTFRKKNVEKPGKSASPNKEHIEKELTQIYENADGSMPDMTHFDVQGRRRTLSSLVLFSFSLIFLCVVAYVGFFLFQPSFQFSEDNVLLSLSGGTVEQSGGAITYRIVYRNTESVSLAHAQLSVRYPDGFVYGAATREPVSAEKNTWDLGDLAPGTGGTIDVSGTFFGSPHEEQSLRAFFTYTPSNFNSQFQKVATLSTAVATSSVSVAITGPGELGKGTPGEYVVTLSPKGTPVASVQFSLAPESGFTLVSSDPKMDTGSGMKWTISELKEPVTIKIKGAFTGESETATFHGIVTGWRGQIGTGLSYVAGEAAVPVTLQSSDIALSLAINGTFDDFTAQPGEILATTINIKNNTGSPITHVVPRLVFDAPSVGNQSLLKWSSLEDTADGNVLGEQQSEGIRRGGITWDSTKISTLREIAPGKEISIDIGLPIKSGDDMDLSALKTALIKAFVDVQYDKDGVHQVLSSQPLSILVNSDTHLGVQHDVSGDTHTVRFIVTNSFHDLQSIEVSADIFGDVVWIADDLVVPAGKAVYDEKAKRVTWTLDSMPSSVDSFALQFGVQMKTKNPTQTNLTSKVRFKAKDVVTGQDIILAGDEVLLAQ